MPLTSSDYRGPLIVVAVGAGFLLVGAVPVAITYSIGVRTSAKIIGMGFVGFGLLLMLPGLCWCVWVRVNAFRKQHWPSSSAGNASASGDDGIRSMVGENHDDDDDAHRQAPVVDWSRTTHIQQACPTLLIQGRIKVFGSLGSLVLGTLPKRRINLVALIN